MRNIVVILLILFAIGILWIGSGFRKFSEETYVNDDFSEFSKPTGNDLDLDFLKKEFEPAYEF